MDRKYITDLFPLILPGMIGMLAIALIGIGILISPLLLQSIPAPGTVITIITGIGLIAVGLGAFLKQFIARLTILRNVRARAIGWILVSSNKTLKRQAKLIAKTIDHPDTVTELAAALRRGINLATIVKAFRPVTFLDLKPEGKVSMTDSQGYTVHAHGLQKGNHIIIEWLTPLGSVSLALHELSHLLLRTVSPTMSVIKQHEIIKAANIASIAKKALDNIGFKEEDL